MGVQHICWAISAQLKKKELIVKEINKFTPFFGKAKVGEKG